ncbi:MAG: bifunctional nuclease family protein [Synechococcales cyanobacterium RM1_1_8]|nr:bifunctional nuclease family protein [Synechococcales cyanobacterium RM1_1_8]NJR52384.1 bifunctional nuclease family protein [Leptolyngbyaceae cyanobacterium CSU_1_3]
MIEMQVDGIAFDAATMSPIVMLTDSDGRRALPIWITQEQAKAIKLAINQQMAPRPLTHDLMVNILEGWEMELDRVVIHSLKDNTYYAQLRLKQGDQTRDVDARPSDAIVLALRLDAPVWVMEEVISNASIPVDQDEDERERREFRQFLSNLSPDDFAKFGN